MNSRHRRQEYQKKEARRHGGRRNENVDILLKSRKLRGNLKKRDAKRIAGEVHMRPKAKNGQHTNTVKGSKKCWTATVIKEARG